MENEKIYKLVECKLHDYKNMPYYIENLTRQIEVTESEINTGISGVSYDSPRLSKSYNICSVIENEIIKKEGRIEKLKQTKKKIEADMLNIENSLNVLNQREMQLFELYYNSRKHVNIDGVAIQMYLDRATVYNIKKVMIQKITNQLYPELTYTGLPLFEEFKEETK